MNYTNSQMSALIDEHIHKKRDRLILKLHFIDGLSADEIAGHKEVISLNKGVDLSTRWVYTIISRSMGVISKFL